MRKARLKRLVSFALSMAMVASSMPMAALAEDTSFSEPQSSETTYTENKNPSVGPDFAKEIEVPADSGTAAGVNEANSQENDSENQDTNAEVAPTDENQDINSEAAPTENTDESGSEDESKIPVENEPAAEDTNKAVAQAESIQSDESVEVAAEADAEIYLEDTDNNFVLGSDKASRGQDGTGGKAIEITQSWMSSTTVRDSIAKFADAAVFDDSFTLFMNVYRSVDASNSNDTNSKNVHFSVGTDAKYINLSLAQGGALRYKSGNKEQEVKFTENPAVANAWASVAICYDESNENGTVTIYIDGVKVVDRQDIGFKLSELANRAAYIGGGFGTGYMGKGTYDRIQITDTAQSEDDLTGEKVSLQQKCDQITLNADEFVLNAENASDRASAAQAVKTIVAGKIAAADQSIFDIAVENFTAPVSGTKKNQNGTQGSVTFAVKFFSKGMAATGSSCTVPISATAYENKYTPYDTFFGADEGTTGSGSVKVNQWLDTEGEHIQAHGGQAQWLDTLDLDGDDTAEGGWIWYGEDKTRNGKPIDGIRCYTSSDLLNWTDRGTVFATHDLVPDKLNSTQNGVELNTENLDTLKQWAEMTTPSETVTQEQIDMAKDFLAAYKTEDGYDEKNLEKAFKYLYSGYCIVERPKMLYNESTKKYVLVWHVDGPKDESIVTYLKGGASPSRYSRAMLGFATSDTPYGPFKLVNVQRMNYRTGSGYNSDQGMARDMTVFLDDTDIDKNGVKDAYAIYSSENNRYIYISLLNKDYTGPATEGTVDKLKLEDGTEVTTFASRVLGTSSTFREAPAVFKYNGYYYMITSGTTGWRPNQAQYHRTTNILGTWSTLGDPCEGGSKTTFVSQPTAVIPVDSAKGKFIYMGDRWSYTLTNPSDATQTDSAHWDSSYVWLPIQINDDGTIVLQNKANWSASVFDKAEVASELPTAISELADLPSKVDVTKGEETKSDIPVTWTLSGTTDFTVQTATGTLGGDYAGTTISTQVAIAPDNLVYFVDAGAESDEGRVFYNLLKDTDYLKNTTAPDQQYSTENGWGYVEGNTKTRAPKNGAVYDIYQMLRYADGTDPRTITYRFDSLEKGSYTVYVGLFEPWSNDVRVANISVKDGDTVLASSEEKYNGKATNPMVSYKSLSVKDGNLQVQLAPKNTGSGSDVQVSWIAIEKNTVKPVITLKGDASVFIKQNETYTDEGATAVDGDGNPVEVTTTITSGGKVVEAISTAAAATYVIHYNAKDNAGIEADEVCRTVTVTAQDTAVGQKYTAQKSDRKTLNMNRSWKFSYGDVDNAQSADFDDSQWADVAIPHNFSIPYDIHTGADGSFYVGYGWYRKDFNVQKEAGKRYNIEFEGVFQVADVYVNGSKIGTHEGGYSSFTYDITDALVEGNNTLAVRVNNIWQPDLTPRGGDYQFTGGIYRDVYLTVTNDVHVDWYGTFVWTPALNNPDYQESENRTEAEWNKITDTSLRAFAKEGKGTTNIKAEDITAQNVVKANIDAKQSNVRVEAEVSNDGDSDVTVTLRNQVVDKATGIVVADFFSAPTELKAGTKGQKIISTSETIENIKLWDFENPNLYQVYTTVADAEETRDVFESTFGFRSVRFSNDGFYLNEKKVKLDGVNAHQDHGGWADAATNEALYRDVKMIDDAGFNFIRGSHYPHDPSYTDYTDEMGIGMWYEGGLWSIGGQNSGNTVSGSYLDWYRSAYPKGLDAASEEAFKQSCYDLVENMIRVNRNHPSVLCWSMGNEVFFSDSSTFQKTRQLVSDLRDYSHSLDPTRKAGVGGTQRNNFNLLAVSDIAGQNGDGVDMRYINPYVPTVISEYDSCDDWDRPGDYEVENKEQAAAGGWPTKNITLADGTTYTFEPAGHAMWCMFDHGSIGSQSLRQTGIVDYYRLPKNAYYAFKNQNTKGTVNAEYPHSVKGTAEKISLQANINGVPDAPGNSVNLTNDGTTDAQLIVTLQDANGNWVNDTPSSLVLEVVDGPGVFPTGKTYTFVKGGSGKGEGLTIMDGRAAIEFRSYYAGETTIRAYVPGSNIEAATITLTTVDTVGLQVRPNRTTSMFSRISPLANWQIRKPTVQPTLPVSSPPAAMLQSKTMQRWPMTETLKLNGWPLQTVPARGGT